MFLRTLLVSILIVVPSLLSAHVRLLMPTPRTPLALKTGPCGGIPRGGEPLSLQAGQELEVEFEEYIDHPGYYQIWFSPANDEDFVLLLDKIPDRQIPVGENSNVYTVMVTMPDAPCDQGTLQVIQYMTETQPPSLYFSCADIRLIDPMLKQFRRGDANADGKVDISDGVKIFEYLFSGGSTLLCLDAADSNDDGHVDISDGISILNWLFKGGVTISDPGTQSCGPDPTSDPIDCSSYFSC